MNGMRQLFSAFPKTTGELLQTAACHISSCLTRCRTTSKVIRALTRSLLHDLQTILRAICVPTKPEKVNGLRVSPTLIALEWRRLVGGSC
jgi:7-keto-8-aminopelargonate synthetase-like enzyme